MNIPTQRDKVKKLFGFDQLGYSPVVLQMINQGKRKGAHDPLYVALLVNDLCYTNVC
jgi:hypothetical protein